MSLFHDLSMEGKTEREQAIQAIRHVLRRIRDHEHVGWYLGMGTESFSLLTEALATLIEKLVSEVRSVYQPRNPQNPFANKEGEE